MTPRRPTIVFVPGLRDHVPEHWQTLLVAHSAGVMMVAHWAQSHDRPIRGALLATPADLEQPLPAGYGAAWHLNPAAGYGERERAPDLIGQLGG